MRRENLVYLSCIFEKIGSGFTAINSFIHVVNLTLLQFIMEQHKKVSHKVVDNQV